MHLHRNNSDVDVVSMIAKIGHDEMYCLEDECVVAIKDGQVKNMARLGEI